MSGHLITKYVNLTETIAVPEEWPIHGLQEFLVPLVEQVIDAVNAGESVVLRVLNLPAKLVLRQDKSGKKYFFEKIFTEELVGSYVIDVNFNDDDRNIQALKDAMGAGNPNAREHKVSLDDYNIHMCQSNDRTAYYFIPATQIIPTLRSVQSQQGGSGQREMTTQRKKIREVMFLLAVVGIPPLLFLIILMETYVN